MCKSGIYKITNIVNSKIYIGQSVNVKIRIKRHKTDLKNNRHHNDLLQKSYNKYGHQNFDFEVIELCDLNQLDSKEVYWISYYKATDRKYGYNFESGGNANKTMHEETKDKIRLSNRASSDLLTETDVREIKIALALNIQHDELVEIYGVHLSTISKINTCKNWEWVLPELNEELINKKISIELERNKIIERMYNEGYSGFKICELSSIPYSYISSYLSGRGKSQVEDRYNSIRKDYAMGATKKEILNKYGISSSVFESAIPNVHYNERVELHTKIMKMFDSGMKNGEIAKQLGLHRTTVTDHIQGRISLSKKQTPLTSDLKQKILNLHTQGLSRRNIAEKLGIGQMNVRKTLKENGFEAKKLNREIAQLDSLGNLIKFWNSINEAGKFINIEPTGIKDCCKERRVSAGGFKWMYKENYDKYINGDYSIKVNKSYKSVIQIDEEKLIFWDSGATASMELNINKNSIYKCCRGIQKTAGGFKWMYKEDYDKLTSSSNKHIS